MPSNLENLKAHILPLSRADNFDAARKEWRLVGIALHREWNSCPCGKAIKELCYIDNDVTGHSTYVGNVCIKRFIGIDTGSTFAGLKRIAADDEANANEDLIEHAWQLGYLYSEKEYLFLLRTAHKRNLSARQLSWKRKINRRIISKTVVSRPRT